MGFIIGFFSGIIEAIGRLLEGWQIKGGIALIVAYCLNSPHFHLFLAFIGLVMVDLFTKQLSISARYIADKYNRDITTIDTSEKIMAFPLASTKGYIESKMMRKKFTTKLFTYTLAVSAAFLTDKMIVSISQPFLLDLTYSYLGVTELLSIFENLKDGGNRTIGGLLDIINERLKSKL